MSDDNIHPISQLPLLVAMVDGILENTEEQYQTFIEVIDKPHVLDDAIVQRAQRLYHTQLDDADLYEAQAQHWQEEHLTTAQQEMIDRMLGQLTRIRDLSQKILELLSEIAKGTIDRIMAMSDEELGLQYLRCNQKKQEKAKKKTSNMQKRRKGVGTKAQLTTPTNKHHQIAQKIHKWVMDIHSRGGGQEEMLTNMIDHMPAFKRVMDSATPDQMDALCVQYPGFYQFALLLEDLAGAIRNGHIEMPED